MTDIEILQRMDECPFRIFDNGENNPTCKYICTRYTGTPLICDGRCSWVVDYPRLREYELGREKAALIEELSDMINRSSGRTTRLIDSYIQELYNNNNEWIEIRDHYDNKVAHTNLLKKIYNRICFEHPQDRDYIEFNRSNNSLKLNKPINKEQKRRTNELIEKLKNFKRNN